MSQLPLPVIEECDPRRIEACRELARIVRKRHNSFEIIDYRKRREAALKGISLRQLSQGG